MASPLDTLYGKRTTPELKKASGATLTEAEIPDGVRVYCEWDDGSTMKIDCYADRVHFLSLTSERKGLYSDLCDTLPKLFKSRGVERFTMSPANEQAEKVLAKRGAWGRGERGMEWVI